MEEKEVSIRDSLEAAVAADPITETSTAVEPVIREEFASPAKVADDTPAESGKVKVADSANDESSTKESVKTEVKYKAPAAWKAGAKERWTALPPDVQEEVVRRERESSIAIQEGTESRKAVDTFNRMLEPYRSVMAAEGTNDPIVAVQNLMQTATTLRLGTPIQKATLIARLIEHYGVDVRTLDGLMGNDLDPQIVQQDKMERMLAERLAPYEQALGQFRQQEQYAGQQVNYEASRTVDEFIQSGEAEFASDPEITQTMADILEVAARRNRIMTLKEAYDQAVSQSPDHARVLGQRRSAAAATNVDRSRTASSSVAGGPMGGGQTVGDGSIRESLLAAMNR